MMNSSKWQRVLCWGDGRRKNGRKWGRGNTASSGEKKKSQRWGNTVKRCTVLCLTAGGRHTYRHHSV